MEIPEHESFPMKRILIIKCLPREVSYCNDLVKGYIAGARNHAAEIKILDLKDLALEPWLKYDWGRNHDSIPTSKDLERAKEFITWSHHMVFAYPTYWAMPPALLALSSPARGVKLPCETKCIGRAALTNVGRAALGTPFGPQIRKTRA